MTPLDRPSPWRLALQRWPRQPLRAGLLLAALQGGLLLSLAALMRIENATQPRGWARTVALDPNLPIRGRYVTFVLQVPVEGVSGAPSVATRVELRVREGRVIALPAHQASGNPQNAWLQNETGGASAQLEKPLAFFLPEHGADPSQRPPGETLWAEVTLPRNGPPRPLRLGVERQPGRIEPLTRP
jgi:hypothetical protein